MRAGSTILPTIALLLLVANPFTFMAASGGTRASQISSNASPAAPSQPGAPVVNYTASNYWLSPILSGGSLSSGQNANLLLSGFGFNNTGGPLSFNHPGGVATDGTHFLLADRNNNRVLVWNSIPTAGSLPDFVLGQPNFLTNNPGTSLGQLDWPVSVSAANGKVVVSDTDNNRILIWNTFPTKDGQPADLAIYGAPGSGPNNNVPKVRNIDWPWGAWTDGTKLVISSTISSLVLIWNSFPNQNNQSADLYLTASGKFGTPRQIISDGHHLIVGDHNPGFPTPPGETSVNFFWSSFPTANDQAYDYYMPVPGSTWLQGTLTQDGKLVLLGTQLEIWNKFPVNASVPPDLTMGSTRSDFSQGYFYDGGDGSAIVSVGSKLFLTLTNGNKIVTFNSFPTQSTQLPDFAIGSPDIYTNTLLTDFIMSNPVPATDGKSLFVSSDFDEKLYVYKNIPDQSGAHPDLYYDFSSSSFQPNQVYVNNNTLILAGGRDIYIWKSLPLDGRMPDLHFSGQIGSAKFQFIKGAAFDGTYLYVADAQTNDVYVWRGIPSNNSTNPTYTVPATDPERMSTDGSHLVVAEPNNGPGGSVVFYDVASLSSASTPVATIGPNKTDIHGADMFNGPGAVWVSQGHLYVADAGFNRLQVWNNLARAMSGQPADTTLGCTGSESFCISGQRIGINTLFEPYAATQDGRCVWVGETKFSERLVRFCGALAPGNQKFTFNIGANSYSGSVSTGSSVTDIAFYAQNHTMRIRFSAGAVPGTMSVSFPVSLINGTIAAKLDGGSILSTTTTNSSATTVQISYSTGVHEAEVYGSSGATATTTTTTTTAVSTTSTFISTTISTTKTSVSSSSSFSSSSTTLATSTSSASATRSTTSTPTLQSTTSTLTSPPTSSSSSTTPTTSKTTSTSSAAASSTTQTTTAAGTTGSGGIPEFPYQLLATTIFSFLLLASYLALRRRTLR